MAYVDTANSTALPLAAGASFTGAWTDATGSTAVVIAVKTDQNGYFSIQFSTDASNADASLTRYYRTNQIEVPHRFTVTRRYVRIVFTNSSASPSTYLRLSTMLGNYADLNSPMDATLSQDYDARVVRPTDYHYEVALGRRQGSTTWNKWGYNPDIDIGTETIWQTGGTFTKIATARTLSVVSTDANDTSAGTGARSVVIYGVDANYASQTVVVTLNGLTPVVTTETWMGVNRVAIYACGSGGVNAGVITATATTEGTIQAEMPVGLGTTQQAFFFVQADHIALMDWLYVSLVKASGTQPQITIKGWVTSLVSGAKYEVFRDYINGDVENHTELRPSQPFVVGEKSLIEFTATTDQNNTQVSCRFSLIEVRDVDA